MTNQQQQQKSRPMTNQAYVSTQHHPPQQNFQLEPQMVRNVVEEDETRDSSSPKETKRFVRKGNAARSKHIETEQRRRSKINERFQILRDLIPDNNDQKRDKASFLLEVIEYVQFLKEKVHTYEGSFHGWIPEPTKLTPRRVNSGQFESFIDQSHLTNHLSGLEDSRALNPTLVNEVQNPLVSNFAAAFLYKPTVNPSMATSSCLHLNMPMQPSFFEELPGQLHRGSVPNAEQLTHQSRSDLGISCINKCPVPLYRSTETERKSVTEEASISSAYSQGLLNMLTNALQEAGVDVSQANISVQLDIRKRKNAVTAEKMFNMKDQENPAGLHTLTPGYIGGECYEHPHKKVQSWNNDNDPLRAKYNQKMAGMNAPIEKPKGSKKLKDWELR